MCGFLLESFIEVSEEEFTQEAVQPKPEAKETPDDVQEAERRSEEHLEEAPDSLIVEEDRKSQAEDEVMKDRREMGASFSPAVDKWEEFDAVSTTGHS